MPQKTHLLGSNSWCSQAQQGHVSTFTSPAPACRGTLVEGVS